MEVESCKILHFENIDKQEVHLRSPNMEKEGMVSCLNFLIDNGKKVTELVTDSSTSVASTLGKRVFLLLTCQGRTLYSNTTPKYTPFLRCLAHGQKIEESTV